MKSFKELLEAVIQPNGTDKVNEAHEVHVSDGSKYDEEPHEHDVKHVNDGVKKHGGKFAGHTDKGAIFSFGNKTDAENFRQHVNKSPKKTVHADHLDESLNDACWKGYEAIGTKKKNGKEVPNCVPVKECSDSEKAAAELKLKLTKAKNGQRAAKALGEETVEEGYLDKQVEQIDELSKNTLKSYGTKAALHNFGKNLAMKQAQQKHDNSIIAKHLTDRPEFTDKEKDKMKRRSEFAKKALHKGYSTEEVEQIDELDKKTLGSYAKKSHDQLMKHTSSVNFKQGRGDSDAFAYAHDKEAVRKTANRTKGLHTAINKLAKEEVQTEQFHVVSNKSYYGTKSTPTHHSSHDNEADAKEALAKQKSADSSTKGYAHTGNRYHKIVNDAGLKKHMKEEVEQIDEISKDTLNSYVHKAFQHGNDLHYDIEHERDKNEKAKMKAKLDKRNTGVIRAAKKLNKEQSMLSFADHIKEATSPMQKLRDAHERHMQKALAANKAGDDEATKVHQQYMQKITAKMNKLKQNEEIDLTEMENLCEISKATLASYIPKAAQSARFAGMTAQDMANRSDRARNKSTKDSYHRLSMKYKNKAWDREDNIKKAAQKLAKEEVEQINEASAWDVSRRAEQLSKLAKMKGGDTNASGRDAHFKAGMAHHDAMLAHKEALKKAEKSGDHVAVGDHEDHIEYHKTESQKHSKLSESVEQIDELSKDTLGNYIKRSSHDAALSARHGGSDPKELKNAIKRLKGIAKATNKLTQEAKDTVTKDKEGKVTSWSHEGDWEKNQKKDPVGKIHHMSDVARRKTEKLAKEEVIDECKVGDDHVNKTEKLRKAGAKEMSLKDKLLSIPRGFKAARAGKSEVDANLKKEETDMITFKQLLDTISEAAIDDLKDRLALKKANQSAYSKGYKPAEKSATTKVKGHSYGAGEEEGEDEEGTKKVSKPTEPEVKRGRGRPAGSKSGARN